MKTLPPKQGWSGKCIEDEKTFSYRWVILLFWSFFVHSMDYLVPLAIQLAMPFL